jgi:ribonuclease HII
MMKSYYKTPDTLEAGIDEAGRGTLIGRVYAASVILPMDIEFEVRDSKKLSRRKRLILKDEIEENAIDFAVASIDNNEIDQINILNASIKAMHQSLKQLNVEPELILVDGNRFKIFRNSNGHVIPHKCIIGGDDTYNSIAAASILAKVYHDEHIEDLCNQYPILDEYYDLNKNMGYGTVKHREGIDKYGVSPFHRQSYKTCFGKELLDL